MSAPRLWGAGEPELVLNVNEPPGRTETSRFGEVTSEFPYFTSSITNLR